MKARKTFFFSFRTPQEEAAPFVENDNEVLEDPIPVRHKLLNTQSAKILFSAILYIKWNNTKTLLSAA